MIHPSYQEMMEHVNSRNGDSDSQLVSSRYSIVLATSKRARQLTRGAMMKVYADNDKMLSVAIKEIDEGKVNIIPGTATVTQDADSSAQ